MDSVKTIMFQTPNMTSVGQMGQSMSAGSPYSYVSPGGGSSGSQGVNVGIAVVAPQPRAVGNIASLQQTRFGVAAGSIGMCEAKLLYSKIAELCACIRHVYKSSQMVMICIHAGYL